MPAFVILSEAKNLMDSGTYTFEILRLTPQNDVVGQAVEGDFEFAGGSILEVVTVTRPTVLMIQTI